LQEQSSSLKYVLFKLELIAIYQIINLEAYVSHCISDCLELPEDYENKPCIYDETDGLGKNCAVAFLWHILILS
jgi:hypothetical protein